MKGILVYLIVAIYCPAASACNPPNHLSRADRAAADSVFIGRIIDLRPPDRTKNSLAGQVYTVKFDVLRMESGQQLHGAVELYAMAGSYAEFPSSREDFEARYGSQVKVGIVTPEHILRAKVCESRHVTWGAGERHLAVVCRYDVPVGFNVFDPGDIPLDRPWIIGTACTIPYIFRIDHEELRPQQRGGRRPPADHPPRLGSSGRLD